MKKPSAIQINRMCKCIRGRTGYFKKGEECHVTHLYQAVDGEFMVEVKSEIGYVQARARRFNIVMP